MSAQTDPPPEGEGWRFAGHRARAAGPVASVQRSAAPHPVGRAGGLRVVVAAASSARPPGPRIAPESLAPPPCALERPSATLRRLMRHGHYARTSADTSMATQPGVGFP